MAAAEQSAQMERYDPLVAPDAQGWLALDEQDRIHLAQDYHERAGIIVPNAKLHAIAHVVVENQVALADALPVERTLRRLMAEGLDRHEALHAIGTALTDFLFDISRDTVPDAGPNTSYLAAVERLTAEQWLRSADGDATEESGVASQMLDDLAVVGRLPIDAIRAADADRAAAVPMFLQAIEQYLAGEMEPSRAQALFFIFHLLGQWREKSAYRSLARLLRRPAEETDAMFDGATTETTHRVMAAVFDGDPQPLYDVVLEPAADEYVRARLCEAVAMVTLRGELPRAEAERFLRTCYSDIVPKSDCFVWHGWQSAIAMLGLVELKPLVEQAFQRGSVSREWLSFQHFEHDLRRGMEESAPEPHGPAEEYSLFGDTIEELSTWYCFSPEARAREEVDADDDWDDAALFGEPVVNPLRHVGRNDPCPCGSGKKFKKCCLK